MIFMAKILQVKKNIVELQKAKQNYFIELIMYYSILPIREQVGKGELKLEF
jgi:hypothetical protein